MFIHHIHITDLLALGQISKKIYPHIYLVALDILPVQASSVPCERVFSSSKETCTARRSRLSPGLLEVLQILKYLYKQERLDFGMDWVSKEEDLLWVPPVTTGDIRELLSQSRIDDLVDPPNASRRD